MQWQSSASRCFRSWDTDRNTFKRRPSPRFHCFWISQGFQQVDAILHAFRGDSEIFLGHHRSNSKDRLIRVTACADQGQKAILELRTRQSRDIMASGHILEQKGLRGICEFEYSLGPKQGPGKLSHHLEKAIAIQGLKHPDAFRP